MTAEIPAGPWRAAFDEAWHSWSAGNFGIGAVLYDPATDEVISRGRNRVLQATPEPKLLTGNFTAHAETNAFAALDRMNANGLHLYTTLESCPMCDGMALMLQVDHTHFAEHDEMIQGAYEVWQHNPFTAERVAPRTGPLGGAAGQLARLLPLTFVAVYLDETPVADNARATRPDLYRLAHEVIADGSLAAVRDGGGDIADALDMLRPRLPA